MINKIRQDIKENRSQQEINLGFIRLIEIIISFKSIDEMGKNKNKKSLFEYLKQKDLTQNNDIILHIAYYNEKFEGILSFTAEEIKNQFEEARLKPPKNINDFLAKLEKNKGYIIECKEKKDGKKTWKLSSSGITYIEF
jgi:hypothetical protein